MIMAQNKPSFIMYCEWKELFQKLDDVQAGKLIKHIFAYVNDENPEAPDVLTDIAFTQIKQQFKRDLKKYQNVVDRNRNNGSKGGRPPKEETQKTQSVILETQTNPKNPIKDKGKGIMVKGERINDKGKDIKDRMVDFQSKIFPHISEKFTREDANDFYRYWTEMNEGGYKMRFEKEKTWNTSGRIVTWIKNKKFAPKNKYPEKVKMNDYVKNLLTRNTDDHKQLT